MKAMQGARTLASELRLLSRPYPKTIAFIVAGLIATVPVAWSFATLIGDLVRSVDSVNLATIYSGLWAVHGGISAASLPILLFVIQLASDERQAALRTHEVLIRETWIFPILIFSLAADVRLGLDLIFQPGPALLALDFLILFVPTLGLAGFAYFSAVRILFSPSRLRSKALSLAKEKISETLDFSIEIRLGNAILDEKMAALNIGYWPFGDEPREAEKYVFVRAWTAGTVIDINIAELEYLLSRLVRPSSPEPSASDSPIPGIAVDEAEHSAKEHTIWLMKRYKQPMSVRNAGLIRILRSAARNLPQAALETHARQIFDLRPHDQ